MREERLVAEWHVLDDTTVASLIGTIDADALHVLVGLRDVARDVPRLEVDLTHVDAIDPAGVSLLETLSAEPNVTLTNLPDAVAHALDEHGRSTP